MLFDEVTSALDPELVGEALAVIRQLGKEQNLTMLTGTHHMAFAREFADRVCFLHQGKILKEDPARVVLSAPREERTRAFLRVVLEA